MDLDVTNSHPLVEFILIHKNYSILQYIGMQVMMMMLIQLMVLLLKLKHQMVHMPDNSKEPRLTDKDSTLLYSKKMLLRFSERLMPIHKHNIHSVQFPLRRYVQSYLYLVDSLWLLQSE